MKFCKIHMKGGGGEAASSVTSAVLYYSIHFGSTSSFRVEHPRTREFFLF